MTVEDRLAPAWWILPAPSEAPPRLEPIVLPLPQRSVP
jgi:hypothetical protein